MLILDKKHPARSEFTGYADVIDPVAASEADIRALRLGVINLMPKKNETENDILRALSYSVLQIEPVWIRMASYSPSGRHTALSHVDSFYQTMAEATADAPLDGLIVTGAPIELLEYEAVKYYEELTQIMDYAREHVFCTLYLCWAALAAGNHYFGIPKRTLPHKLAGVFTTKNHQGDQNPFTRGMNPTVRLCQSRDADFEREALDRVLAAGQLESLLESAQPLSAEFQETVGPVVLATPDQRILMNLGHFEYHARTLMDEIQRDQAQQPPKLYPVQGYFSESAELGSVPEMTWKSDRTLFFGNFVTQVYRQMNSQKRSGAAPFRLIPQGEAA